MSAEWIPARPQTGRFIAVQTYRVRVIPEASDIAADEAPPALLDSLAGILVDVDRLDERVEPCALMLTFTDAAMIAAWLSEGYRANGNAVAWRRAVRQARRQVRRRIPSWPLPGRGTDVP